MGKKKVILSGFNTEQIYIFKKKFKKLLFSKYKKSEKLEANYDAFISINRKSFEDFYYSNFKQLSQYLKWIHISAAGLDNYKKIFSLPTNCKVTNGRIIQGPAAADHAMAMLLALTRNINIIIKKGTYAKFSKRPVELKGKKILIVGYGGIGKCIAERAFGFGMKVYAVHDAYRGITSLIEKFYSRRDYKEALKDKDVIVYSLPLTSKTKNLYNATTSKIIKKGAYLINVCRGEIVCEETLYKKLKNNYLAGAGVDVLESDKKIDKKNKFFKLNNFIFTPHIAGISDGLKLRNYKLIYDNLEKFNNNEKLINIINPEDLK